MFVDDFRFTISTGMSNLWGNLLMEICSTITIFFVWNLRGNFISGNIIPRLQLLLNVCMYVCLRLQSLLWDLWGNCISGNIILRLQLFLNLMVVCVYLKFTIIYCFKLDIVWRMLNICWKSMTQRWIMFFIIKLKAYSILWREYNCF